MVKRSGVHPSGGTAKPAPRRPIRTKATSPFVGRDEEMNRLTAALDLAADGQGGAIFLTGEPGIGKTRLAREALALARERDFTVLEGRAYPMEAGLAYAPFLDAFGSLLRKLDSSHVLALVSGLPSLGRLFEGLHLSPPEPLGDPALEKTRLFEAVSRLLERLTCERPVVVFMDDVDRCDPASLELLHYLARRVSDRRTLILATYSAQNVSNGLRAMARSLGREGFAEEIVVPRLRPGAVADLIRGILQAEAPGDLLSLVDARAAGTPLFIKALVDALVDSGNLVNNPSKKGDWIFDAKGATALPASVRHLILERLERLEPDDRRVLELIAVMGDATSHDILRGASGLREKVFHKSLRRLRDAGLVAEGTDGLEVIYNLTHPLIQEVACAELPEMERRRAHLAAIKTLESRLGARPDNAGRLARHYRGAGPEADPERTLAMLLAAGDRERSAYANEEAAKYYVAALAMIRQGGGGYSVTLPDLLERLGEVWERTGEGGAAVGVWNEALVERERAGLSDSNAMAASRLRCRLALAEWDRGHFGMANAHVDAGLALLAGREPCQELADLHFTRHQILSRVRDAAGVADTAAKLLSVAKRLAQPLAEAEAHLVAAISCLWQNSIVDSREHALRCLEKGEQAQEPAICCRSHDVLALIGMRLGDHQFMRYHAERGLAIAQRLGVPNLEVFLRLRLSHANFLSGAWEESLHCSSEAIALARRVGYPRDLAYSMGGRAVILALLGQLSEAEACIAEVRTAFGSPSIEGPTDRTVFNLIDIAETAIALERGQVKRALLNARAFFCSPASENSPAGLWAPYIPLGLMLLAEAQVAAGEPAAALETAGKLSCLGSTGTSYVSALSARAEGLARLALGQREDALSCLNHACEAFSALGMPFEAARSLLEHAEVVGRESGERGQGMGNGGLTIDSRPLSPIQAAHQSLLTFKDLGAHRYADRARKLLGELGALPPDARQPCLGGVPVSARQLEIARLVAHGLTTAEIAVRLTLSQRTVSTHLDHIYSRLGISSRTALTRQVIEAGLL